MSSGWPSQDDSGSHPSGQRQVPFGPDASWPGGYNGAEYRDGDHRYPAQPGTQEYPGQQYSPGHQYPSQPTAALPAPPNHGEHPYASYNSGGYPGNGGNGQGYAQPAPDAFGYGDPGYSNPGYDGPSSQDAGVTGIRTVRGYVEPGYQGQGYPALPAPTSDYSTPGYGQPASHAQPWDYNQPLRYDDEPGYRGSDQGAAGSYPAGYADSSHGSSYNTADYETGAYDGATYDKGGYDRGGYDSGAYDAAAYKQPGYDRDAYNGSDLSRPGIGGLGYDLSEIIGTADFPAFGYDEPSVQRLAYDDPRFDDVPGGQDGYDDLRGGSGYDGSRFDETRLDNFFQDGDDRSGSWFDGSREDSGRGGVSRDRSDYRGLDRDGGARSGAGAGHGGQRPTGSHRAPASNETRLDLGFRGDQVRRDAPAYGTAAYASGPLRLSGPMKFDSGLLRMSGPMRFDETRLDNMPALAAEPSRTATGLLAPPEFAPIERSWVDETSLDSFGGLELDLLAPRGLRDSGALAIEAPVREDRPAQRDTDSQRTVGKRRGRSSDRRQWLALGAVVVVAAGAIGGVLAKFHFAGPSGPAHSISTPAKLDAYTRSPSQEKAMDVSGLREQVIKGSSGQAYDVVSGVYVQGNMTPGAGGSQEIFMFVGGHLHNTAPASSITSFKQTYPTAQTVPAGSLGGEAACVTTKANNESVAMCVFFDNDSFGTLVSPTMSTAQLANTMDQVRPGIEHVDR
ncbi:MAG: hypothetical protein JWM19_6355 [Actinomycetia bacterium]|nr:hypothetical protein [Actinomycetes bacterium]